METATFSRWFSVPSEAIKLFAATDKPLPYIFPGISLPKNHATLKQAEIFPNTCRKDNSIMLTPIRSAYLSPTVARAVFERLAQLLKMNDPRIQRKGELVFLVTLPHVLRGLSPNELSSYTLLLAMGFKDEVLLRFQLDEQVQMGPDTARRIDIVSGIGRQPGRKDEAGKPYWDSSIYVAFQIGVEKGERGLAWAFFATGDGDRQTFIHHADLSLAMQLGNVLPSTIWHHGRETKSSLPIIFVVGFASQGQGGILDDRVKLFLGTVDQLLHKLNQ